MADNISSNKTKLKILYDYIEKRRTSLCWSLVSDYEEEGKDNPELERNEMEDENLVDTGKVKIEVT